MRVQQRFQYSHHVTIMTIITLLLSVYSRLSTWKPFLLLVYYFFLLFCLSYTYIHILIPISIFNFYFLHSFITHQYDILKFFSSEYNFYSGYVFREFQMIPFYSENFIYFLFFLHWDFNSLGFSCFFLKDFYFYNIFAKFFFYLHSYSYLYNSNSMFSFWRFRCTS